MTANMFLRSFRGPARDVASLPRAAATAAAAPAPLLDNQEDWVRTDLVHDGLTWAARFSDHEIHSAARAIGLLGPAPSEPSSDDVESIDGDAQMRDAQRAVPPAFSSVTDLAITLAQRPGVQAAMMEEVMRDPALMEQMKGMFESHGLTGLQLRVTGPPQQPQLLWLSEGDDGDDKPHPLEAIIAGIVAATKHTGAAIGAFLQRMVARVVALSRLLRGRRVTAASGLVVDEDGRVDRSRVLMDMSFALAALLVVVVMLGRGGVRVG